MSHHTDIACHINMSHNMDMACHMDKAWLAMSICQTTRTRHAIFCSFIMMGGLWFNYFEVPTKSYQHYILLIPKPLNFEYQYQTYIFI
jgi:hypothetical protein